MTSVPRIPDHGGRLASAMARFGAGEDWLDLSTGINPWPYPVPDLDAAAWHRLPDDDALDALKQAARRFYGAGSAAIAAAPGSQALIQLLPRLLPPSEVAICAPSYAEHARCWRLAGHSVIETADPLASDAAIAVIVDPNNPDGKRWSAAAVQAAARSRAVRGGLVVIDQAFAEVVESSALDLGQPGLIALRSIGKFFGLAGLRLGFALGAPWWIERIEDALGPWAVSGPALAIGQAALDDAGWAAATRARLAKAASALDAVLDRPGFAPVGGTDLFRLVRVDNAAAVLERLGQAHILARGFSYRPDWLRFGLPPDEAALARLDRVFGAMTLRP